MTQPNTEPGEIALQAGKDISLDVYENPDKCGKSFAITIQRAINDSTAALRRKIAELKEELLYVANLLNGEDAPKVDGLQIPIPLSTRFYDWMTRMSARLATAEAALEEYRHPDHWILENAEWHFVPWINVPDPSYAPQDIADKVLDKAAEGDSPASDCPMPEP